MNEFLIGIAWLCGSAGVVLGQTGSIQHLGVIDPANPISCALCISPDGSVISGYSRNGAVTHQTFRWRQTDGLVALAHLTSGGPSIPLGVANNGIIVGQSRVVGGDTHPARWIGNLPSDLGILGGMDGNGAAYELSADGSVIVGQAQISGSDVLRAFAGRAPAWSIWGCSGGPRPGEAPPSTFPPTGRS